MTLRLIPLIAAVLFLNACGTVSHIPEEYRAAPEEAAFLVGSIAVQTSGEEEQYGDSSLEIRQVGSDASAHISFYQSGGFPSAADYQTADKEGGPFALALEPGNYEFVNVSFFYNYAYYTRTYTAEEDFSVPFTLEAGKVYYVGEFLSFGRYGRNLLGLSIPTGGYFVNTNNFEHDWPLLLAKHPEIANREIVQLDLNFNVHPFVYSADLFKQCRQNDLC